jgi:hypothetical protein
MQKPPNCNLEFNPYLFLSPFLSLLNNFEFIDAAWTIKKNDFSLKSNYQTKVSFSLSHCGRA